MELTHISLFTGIGGIDLAAEWTGFKTVLMVENNAFCQKVLRKHWPDVPILEDIFNVSKETIEQALADTACRQVNRVNGNDREAAPKNRLGADKSDSRSTERYSTDTSTIPPITLITGGFPCQPFSVAGKQRGKEDDRYLWPEMLRVIKEVRPRWVVAENVAGLIRMGLDDCLSDLEGAGYTTETFIIPACAVNAPHRRDRIFIVAYSGDSSDFRGRGQDREKNGIQEVNRAAIHSGQLGRTSDVADTDTEGLQGRERKERSERASQRPVGESGASIPNAKDSDRWRSDGEDNTWRGYPEVGGQGFSIRGEEHWSVEPDVGRVAHGVPSRVDRLKALGNAVVPQQIYPILKAIADIERGS